MSDTTGGIEEVLRRHLAEKQPGRNRQAWAPDLAAAVRAYLLSDAVVERAARALAQMESGEGWATNEALGGSLTGTRDDEYQAAMTEDARAALAAAVGGDE